MHLNILAVFPSNSGMAISGAVSGKVTGIWNENGKNETEVGMSQGTGIGMGAR